MDPRVLHVLAASMAEGDPIDWDGLTIDPALVYDVMAGQVATMMDGYAANGVDAEARLRLATAALVKLNVEVFALSLRLAAFGEGPLVAPKG